MALPCPLKYIDVAQTLFKNKITNAQCPMPHAQLPQIYAEVLS
ncbi:MULTISPECIES: hypothetical protein [unclassified Calothrix]|nr:MULTISPECIES: hypothetical protein [unclassified Calothrix]